MGKVKLAIFIDGEFWHGCNWGEKKSRITTITRFQKLKKHGKRLKK
ncbi:MAG: hypothetical protein PSV16_12670 [Flavobacterium sp.]|nr:hypothetical protein [Flavobacterium sp.]